MKTYKKCFLLIMGLSYLSIGNAQPNILWQHCFGGSFQDFCSAIQTTHDNGYIICGTTGSDDGDVVGQHGNSTSFDIWVVKLNSSKNIMWSKCFGSASFEGALSINETADFGFIICGQSEFIGGDVTNNNGGQDIWIIKTDSIGNIKWQKSYGSSYLDGALYIEQTKDNGYIACCVVSYPDHDVTLTYGGQEDYWILKLDSVGNIQWEKTYGGSDRDRPYVIRQLNDGNYIVAGYTYSFDFDISFTHGNGEMWVIKLDTLGNKIWEKTYGGSSIDEAYNIYPLANGDYILCGVTYSVDGDITSTHYGGDAWFLKLDSIGNIIWQKTYGGFFTYDILRSVLIEDDGSYVLACYSNSYNGDASNNYGGFDIWLLKVDSVGTILWQKSYGGSSTEIMNGSDFIVKNAAGNYVVACTSLSIDFDVSGNHGGPHEVWLFELDNITGINESANQSIAIYPNPATSILNINLPSNQKAKEVTLYDMQGRMVLPGTVVNQYPLQLTVQGLTPGIYAVKVICNTSSYYAKVVIKEL